jgi:hypothetical protein
MITLASVLVVAKAAGHSVAKGPGEEEETVVWVPAVA